MTGRNPIANGEHQEPNGTSSASPALSKNALQTTASHLAPSFPQTDPNNWSNPGPAAFDFRSDTITTPTASMLSAITSTTLLDDVFQEDPTTNELDAFMADLTGKEAALFVMSGTMGNQVALRTHLQGPPHAILADHRSHIIRYEAGGVASLSQAMVQPVIPKNGKFITLEEVKEHAVLSDDQHACPTKVISLENTLNGMVMPLDECRRISEWARQNDIIMHLDGARLWNAVASGAGALKEYADCFDSMSLCYSKGLGAPIGSIIVGTKTFIKRARWIRKSIGGGIRMAGVLSSAARVSVEETFLGGKLAKSHENAVRIAKMWESYGGKLDNPTETNMVWLDLNGSGVPLERFKDVAGKEGLRVLGGRLVVHYQISDEAIERLERVMKTLLKDGKGENVKEENGGFQYAKS